MKRRLAAGAAAAVILWPVVAACAGGSALPEAPPCVNATPTPRPTRATEADFRYLRTFQSASDKLQRLTDDWRAAWPEGKFSSRPEFRQEFVVYASASRCLVDDLAAFAPANAARYGEFDSQVEGALVQYRDAIDYGLEAVRKRNVSNYREFYKRIDAAHTRLDETIQAAGQP